jgi:hypothetical protein
MRTILIVAVGFYIGNRLASKYHTKAYSKIQSIQRKRLKAYLKQQGLSETESVNQTRSIFNI